VKLRLGHPTLEADLAAVRAVVEGNAMISERPGAGLAWNEEAVNRYRFC
jgi:L-alanine-DL-glutamate epimerase-like enolase superfamily enzyme